MNLKEHFIKSIEILCINKDEIKIIENYKADFCNEKECDGDISCKECKYNYTEVVDLAIIDNYYGEEYYYSFKATKNRNINSVTNYKKMYKELEYIKGIIVEQRFEDVKSDLKYYDKINRLKKYAEEYAKILSEKYFPRCNAEILPIRFYDLSKNEEKIIGDFAGNYLRFCLQSVIEVYNCMSTSEEDLKVTIKHELLHYFLDMQCLKNADNDGVFHALAKIEDADPYGELSKEEQKEYDLLMFVYENSPYKHDKINKIRYDFVDFLYQQKQKSDKYNYNL